VLALLRLASTKLLMYSQAKLLATLNSLYAKAREKVLGNEHPDALISIANLASTYSNQGRSKEADALFVQVTGTRKSVIGEKHPNMLANINNQA
jgi:hypothetical protein